MVSKIKSRPRMRLVFVWCRSQETFILIAHCRIDFSAESHYPSSLEFTTICYSYSSRPSIVRKHTVRSTPSKTEASRT